jgi:acetyl esterase/lipase
MQNWRNAIHARLTRMIAPRRIDHATPLAELRKIHEGMFAGFGPTPHDVKAEKAQLGQIKGEWIRVSESHPNRLVLYLHGGGFIAGSPESHRSLIANLCKVSGAAALAVDYRLAPEYPFPAGLRDAVDAYRLLIAKGMSPDSIVIAGDGAGGGLAFAAVMAIRNASMPMPAGCLAISPWADLTLSGWSMMQNADFDELMSWELLFLSSRAYLKGSNPADPYASPVFGNLRDFPPVMVHAGSLEILRDDASRLGELAAAANVPVSVEVYDGMPHCFQAYPSIAESKVSLTRLGQFVRARVPEQNDSLDFSKSAKRGR